MDIDENDILFTNQFISKPELKGEVSEEFNDEFRKYYRKEKEKREEKKLKDSFDRLSLRSIHLDEENDTNSIINTNRYNDNTSIKTEGVKVNRQRKEIKTYVNIDSRDRDKKVYPKPSHFKMFLGKTFYNVKTIKLASIEFPNTHAVINTTNNKIYWRNQEDIDDNRIDTITDLYPVYESTFRIGSYITTTLRNEMVNKMKLIKRKNGTGDYHYFQVDLDIDTDIVTFTSLILQDLGSSPLRTEIGSNIIYVTADNHGFANGETVYIVGSSSLAGIAAATINTSHVITYISEDLFSIQVTTKAGASTSNNNTTTGGGSNVKVGRAAPFQLLFGESPNTIAPNIGFPYENSSQRIDTHIKKIENIYLAQIKLQVQHRFSNNETYINQLCTITGNSEISDGNYLIIKILDPYTLVVKTDSPLTTNTNDSGVLTFPISGPLMQSYFISTTNRFGIDTVLLETFSDHSYAISDSGDKIRFYDTTCVPDFNTENTVFAVLTSTQLVFYGYVLQGTNVSDVGAGGSFPRHQPLYTYVHTITGVTLGPGDMTTFECIDHNLQVGDYIKFYNMISQPSLSTNTTDTHRIESIIGNDYFIINYKLTSFDANNIAMGNVKIGTQIVKVSFPYHGFNKITNITNNTTANQLIVTTQLDHQYTSTGGNIIISGTNVDNVNEGHEILQIIDNDEFIIDYNHAPLSSNITSGTLGLNQDLYIYGATPPGGLRYEILNNNKYTVRTILDQHNFTISVNDYANKQEKGGGTNVYLSSLIHGFSGVQANTKNSLLNRSINLEGENYAFLCCPQLATMMNTGDVKEIFARITLDQSPGSVVFSYLSNPKEFDVVPLDSLNELEFSVKNYNDTLYDFNDLDYSFVLEITEIVDTIDNFNYSSRRGVTES